MSAHRMAGWFLGPKAENSEFERSILNRILEDHFEWRRNHFPSDEVLITPALRREASEFHQRLAERVEEMLAALRGHFPGYSPRHLGHMISDQTLPSQLGYFAGLLYNPNNVTPESAPVTVKWELEVGADILRMVGYTPPPQSGRASREFGWAHITSGGTIANLEALWVARNVRYFPLAVRDVCRRRGITVPVKSHGSCGALAPIESIPLEACLGLSPDQAIHLYARYVESVHQHWKLARAEAVRVADELLIESKYSIRHHGTAAAYGVRPPVLLVSGARHYSIDKAADLLGIGHSNIEIVDIDEQFRMDHRDLEAKLRRALESRRLPVAVIAVAGTTEEGAVDPVDRIAEMRGRLEETLGESFWLHIDAAWGGYLRTLFTPGAADLETSFDEVRRFVSRSIDDGGDCNLRVSWPDRRVFAAFAALPRAESITVDPHKMGYVPYPCGVIAFKDDRVRQFLTEDIPYFDDAELEAADWQKHRAPVSVGAHILEGSKPGSAVAACWLSHRAIPPDRSGYGEILRASLLAAREFYERLLNCSNGALPYRILPVTPGPPDTNIVCFLAQANPGRGLAHTNALNQWLYRQFSGHAPDNSPPFFLSKTVFKQSSYSSAAIRALLDRAGIEAADYRLHGLFVLRATIMSPYYVMAAETGNRQSLLKECLDVFQEKVLAGLAALDECPPIEDQPHWTEQAGGQGIPNHVPFITGREAASILREDLRVVDRTFT